MLEEVTLVRREMSSTRPLVGRQTLTGFYGDDTVSATPVCLSALGGLQKRGDGRLLATRPLVTLSGTERGTSRCACACDIVAMIVHRTNSTEDLLLPDDQDE